MFKKFKWIIYTPAFISFAYYLVRLYSLTFRLRVKNEKSWLKVLDQGGTVLLVTWHQQFFSAIRHFKTHAKYNPGLMISRSRDGDLISGVANRTGWHTARGSSSRGGKTAMEAMIKHLNQHRLGAHILDGPQGPMGKVKAGAVKMARETGALVVPFYIKPEKAWYFRSWDRFMLPKPFSRVTLIYDSGEIFEQADGDERDAGFETQRKNLEEKMLPHLIFPD